MKRTFTFLLLILAQLSIFSQAYIGNKLYDRLLEADQDEYLSINIYLTKQVNVDSLHNGFRLRNTPLELRSKQVIHELQQLAGLTQYPLLQFINQNDKDDVRNLQSFWIINMVSLEAKPEFIFRLAERGDIETIELNTVQLKIEEPIKIRAAGPKALGVAEPGLIAINARKLWALGYTGRNRVGMNVDTGINFKHPSIRNNYLGLYFPISQCWLPFNNPTPFDISSHSHGTHTIGTMMGLDTATHDTVGVAFRAHWISSDPIVSDLYYLRTLPEVMSSFEWALNPDGDTSTVYDMPDVINNSWGWVDPPDTFQCNSPYTAIMEVCEAAGIATVFSAGNDGDLGPGSVGEPAHKAKTLVNAFAVGSVNGNNSALLISDFSSRGPTVCADTGSLQIKPEVVAPGQDVRSAMGQDSYGLLSGTSMAGPHAAGAILLLKEAYPFLSGEELKLALYYSAVDLGPVGEDNAYGNGIIDVFAAYNYLAQTYTPVPPSTNDWELVLEEIISPTEELTCNTLFTPQIKFGNKGINTISEVGIKLFVDQQLIADTSWTGSLTGGQSEVFSLNPIELLQGYRSIQFELNIAGNPDELNRFNNFGSHEFRIARDFDLPYMEDFETANRLFTNTDWFLQNDDDVMTWKVDTVNGLPNSERAVFMDYYLYKPVAGQMDHLISPLLNLPDTGGIDLIYNIAYRQRVSFTDDSLKIFVSTDCGASFPYLVYANGGDSLKTYQYNYSVRRFVPDIEDHWRKDTVDLSQFAGSGQIMLKFTGINNGGNSLWLDNIEVVGKPGLVSVEEASTTGFKIYPNPASDQINIVFDRKPSLNSSLQLLDVQGQDLFTQACSTEKLSVDISNYVPGVYYLRYVSEKNIFFKRFVVMK